MNEDARKNGAPFPAEMLVFSGMISEQVDAFLEEYKKTGLPAIGLKAVVTLYNVVWTAEALFCELIKEEIHFSLSKRTGSSWKSAITSN